MTTILHIGKKIERIREIKGMKQETLAGLLGITQQAVSKLEHTAKVDDEKLKQVAKALDITPEAILGFKEDAAINNISNIFNDNAVQNNINPIEKIVELYERMLQLKDEVIELYKRKAS